MPQITPLPPATAPAGEGAKDAKAPSSAALPSFLALLADMALSAPSDEALPGEVPPNQAGDLVASGGAEHGSQPAAGVAVPRWRDRSRAVASAPQAPLLGALPIPITLAPLPPDGVSLSGQGSTGSAVNGMPIVGGKLLAALGDTPAPMVPPVPHDTSPPAMQSAPAAPQASALARNAPVPAISPSLPEDDSQPAVAAEAGIGDKADPPSVANGQTAIGLSDSKSSPLAAETLVTGDPSQQAQPSGMIGAKSERPATAMPTSPSAASATQTATMLASIKQATTPATEAAPTRHAERSIPNGTDPSAAATTAPLMPGTASAPASRADQPAAHPAVQHAADQIVARAAMLQRGQATELHMQLRPPDLGDLSVTLRRDLAGALSVHLVPANGEASRVLAANLHHLGAALDAHSSSGHASVTLGQRDAAGQHRDRAADQDVRTGHAERHEDAQQTAPSARSTAARMPRAIRTGGVDYDA
jgi:hypothetical protein